MGSITGNLYEMHACAVTLTCLSALHARSMHMCAYKHTNTLIHMLLFINKKNLFPRLFEKKKKKKSLTKASKLALLS